MLSKLLKQQDLYLMNDDHAIHMVKTMILKEQIQSFLTLQYDHPKVLQNHKEKPMS